MRFRSRTKMAMVHASHSSVGWKESCNMDKKKDNDPTDIIHEHTKLGLNKKSVGELRLKLGKSDICIELNENKFRRNKQILRSTSLESIASGISSGSAASEERQNTLKSVASYSSLSSKSERRTQSPHFSPDKTKTDERKPLKKCSFAGFPVATKPELIRKSKSHPILYLEEDVLSKISERSSNISSKGKNISSHGDKNHAAVRCDNFVANASIGASEVKYDPALEKSKTFLHGQGKTFSKANQYLTPARPGLQKLQISYTQTNTENNHRKIFCDLVKNAHRQNLIIGENVKSLERRLLIRRTDPSKSTTFYEQKGLVDPIRIQKKKKPRTVAEKQKERKERIKQTSDEIKIGYIPTEQTMKIVGPEEIERLRSCTYLRVDNDLTEQ